MHSHHVTSSPLMAQSLADAIEATKRQVQIWTDAGLLKCRPETDRQGRGRQRLYDPDEIPFAALVAQMARFKIPIGVMIGWTVMVRNLAARGEYPSLPGARPVKWYDSAIRGERESFIVFNAHSEDIGRAFAWMDREKMVELLDLRTGAAVINVKEVTSRAKKRHGR